MDGGTGVGREEDNGEEKAKGRIASEQPLEGVAYSLKTAMSPTVGEQGGFVVPKSMQSYIRS